MQGHWRAVSSGDILFEPVNGECLVTKLSFSSFWAGEHLSPYEMACLGSFVERGFEVNLFSYDPVANPPDGVRLHDAREIVDEDAACGFVVDGKASLSHFSDYFRYRLFSLQDTIWIDSDLLLLKCFDVPLSSALFAREEEN